MRKKRSLKMKKALAILRLLFFILLNVVFLKAFIYGIDAELDYNLHKTEVHLAGVCNDLKKIENFQNKLDKKIIK